jgi:hypothetical protein
VEVAKVGLIKIRPGEARTMFEGHCPQINNAQLGMDQIWKWWDNFLKFPKIEDWQIFD